MIDDGGDIDSWLQLLMMLVLIDDRFGHVSIDQRPVVIHSELKGEMITDVINLTWLIDDDGLITND